MVNRFKYFKWTKRLCKFDSYVMYDKIIFDKCDNFLLIEVQNIFSGTS